MTWALKIANPWAAVMVERRPRTEQDNSYPRSVAARAIAEFILSEVRKQVNLY